MIAGGRGEGGRLTLPEGETGDGEREVRCSAKEGMGERRPRVLRIITVLVVNMELKMGKGKDATAAGLPPARDPGP